MRFQLLSLFYYGAALFGLYNPRFGLLFLINIIIFRPENLVWGQTFSRLHSIATLCAFGGFLLNARSVRTFVRNPHQEKNVICFLVFIVWLVIVSILAEVSKESSFIQTWEVTKIFVFCFLFSRLIRTSSELNNYVWVAVGSFGLLSAWGILQSMAGNERLDDLWSAGSVGLAAQLALMTPLAIGKTFDPEMSIRGKLVFWGCALAMIICTIASQSRGGILGLISAGIVFVTWSRYRARLVVTFIFAMLLILPFVSAAQYERINSIFLPQEVRDNSANSRLDLWRIAIRMWQDHPIAGVGLDNFSDVKEMRALDYAKIVQSDQVADTIFGKRRMPHGTYTGMLSETGLIGIGIFLVFLVRNLLCKPYNGGELKEVSYRGLYMQTRGAQAGVAGFAVSALFGDLQYIEMLYLQIFFIGSLVGVQYVQTEGEPSFIMNRKV